MLILIRHGQTNLNAAGALAGRTEADLTDLGHAQARATGALLGPVHEVRSSSLRRAQQTAALLETGAPHVIDDRFIEVDYGVLDGTPLTDVPVEYWERWITDASYAPEGGESLLDLEARVNAAMEELFAPDGPARATDSDLVVVSHVSPIKAAVAWVLKSDPLVAWRMRLSNASMTRIEMGPRGPVLLSFNEVPPL